VLQNIGQTQFAQSIRTVVTNPVLKQTGMLVKLVRLSSPAFHDSMQQYFCMSIGQTYIYIHVVL